ncbi:MAG: glycosyltransferase [Pseudomonas sp.]|uniref:Glycosyltransferase family 2 protein n=3 Tax=Gammaproteobacteria TaxID=1236 RepID=A0A7L9G966_9PSED|nr:MULTISPECIES: glycosyltransferase family 2 protein [Pseudomonas]AFK67950.1 glycosyl transferase family protein [Pseudomonas putida ND6]MPT01277.1 glycosyltransferase [Pseudomonas sp.]QOJ88873.1 glycosyltransferase family 2 protein [Pseudomonas taiwanensis]WQQ35774.1 glycosyltransferase family 2 protein [Pseudomonas putida]
MNKDLLGKPQAGHPSAAQHAYKGAILGLQGDVLHGWAINTADPEQRPVVEVFIDYTSVALARADQYEPLAPEGDQFHGFTVQLRHKWLSVARTISVRLANQDFSLDGDILLPVAPTDDAASIASQVWHTGGLRVAGWSWDPQAPNRHVEVIVREGDQIVCSAISNIHHQALAYRDTSDHGFAIDLPWELADGRLHVLDILNDRGQPLAGSPIRICCWPEGVEGLLRELDPAHDAPTISLLTEVAKEQTLRLPKSASWAHYPQWFETFHRLESREGAAPIGKPGLLLITAGDAALEQVSLASLGDDRSLLHHVVSANPTDTYQALRQLIASGCDSILPLKAGDRLAPHALPHFCALLDDGSAWGFSDCDRDDEDGARSYPWLKPVWDIDLFIGADIYTPGAIFGVDIVAEALSLLGAADEKSVVSWYDLSAGIALATQNTEAIVTHLPRMLYHRAANEAASPELAPACQQRQQAITWLCDQLATGTSVSTVDNYPALLRAHWPLPAQLPLVSLIVPTRDQYTLLSTCIEGLINHTDYPALEIIVVDNQSSDQTTLDYLVTLERRGITILRHPYPFNYSTINNRAAEIARGELIGLVNNDIEIIDSHWLKEMVAQLMRPRVGAVGAKLLWPNRMVQHGGVVVGVNGLAAHAGNALHDTDAGYLALNQISRKQSAVTAACLLLRKSTFAEVGGLDEEKFPVAFNDVDMCLKIRSLGLSLVWSPFAKLIHAESASRGKDVSPDKQARATREQEHFRIKWCSSGQVDPHYHPALSTDYLSGPYGGLSIPSRNYRPRWLLDEAT